jgi:hypothetical protein
MTDISFDSKDLKVDYLSFNLQFNDINKIQKVANYLMDAFGYKTILLNQLTEERSRLVKNNKNSCSGEFIINSSKYWAGTILRFTGDNAQCFYKDLKFQKLDWSIFDLENTNLGRIDLCYDRKLKPSDTNLNLFLENSRQQIIAKKGNLSVTLDGILRVGKRASPNFFRVYLRENGRDLRFEMEVKKNVVKRFQHYLFTGQVEIFEEFVTQHFYNQAIELFDIENCYADWLLVNFRIVKKLPIQEVLVNSFSLSYLTYKPVHDFDLLEVEFFYRLVQLLNYLKSLEITSKSILMGDQSYQTFQFPVNDFLKFIGRSKENHYQIKKLVMFLKSLQRMKPILENFSDGGFRSYVAFPFLKVERSRSWLVELTICKELYLYRYPFYLPKNFLNYQNNFELEVKFILLQSFSNILIQKEFPTQEFLERVSVSNSKSAKLKKYIVKFLHELKNSKAIEPEFKILTKRNEVKTVNVLTSTLVSQSISIFYRENIKINYKNYIDI